MKKEHIYLDYNASAPIIPAALEVMGDILSAKNFAYNASSIHHFGQIGHRYIETARKKVANLVDANKDQVIFNSGATEGNNTILLYFANKYPNETILITQAQHPSIMEALNILDNVKTVPVDKNGLVRLDILEEVLSNNSKVSLVSCTYANNETGIIQDVRAISNLAHKYGALLHCDGVQAVGKIPVSMIKDGIDFLTISSHKIGGAQGAGALISSICGQTPFLLFGGGQEKYMRSGTQNIAAIASFGVASYYALKNIEQYRKDITDLRYYLESRILEISSDIIIHGKNVSRIPNTSFFYINGINAQNILMALDLENIAISNGSACSSGNVKPSNTLKSMGYDEEIASNSLRISIGWATKKSDIDIFLMALEKILNRIAKRSK